MEAALPPLSYIDNGGRPASVTLNRLLGVLAEAALPPPNEMMAGPGQTGQVRPNPLRTSLSPV